MEPMFTMYVEEMGGVWFTVVLGEDKQIFATSFSLRGRREAVSSILENIPTRSCLTEIEPEGPVLEVLKSMSLIYEGKPVERKVKLNMDRLPPFTKNALLMTCRIPRGYVATYKGIAEALGNKGAARAVGNAEAKNPFAPIVPCHRVVATNLGLGGYGGGLDVKRAFLEREGVSLIKNCILKESLWIPTKESAKI